MDREFWLPRYQGQTSDDYSSRLPGFYQLSLQQRVDLVKKVGGLTDIERSSLSSCGSLSPELIDVFIENAVGTLALPLGVATNFVINGQEVLVPMAVEETSVLAAASHGAKLARAGGGFLTESTDPVMTGQVQVYTDDSTLLARLQAESHAILEVANQGLERLIARGGGAHKVSFRWIKELGSIIVYLDINTQDAMGANIVNTVCERVALYLEKTFGCSFGLRILTNLTDKRLARATTTIPAAELETDAFSGQEVGRRIEQAYLLAAHDVYRAATHNKGVMNGIDPLVIATGNDWRAVEAGAHAYCARLGVYAPMTKWEYDEDLEELVGAIELPIAVGTVGGVTKLNPTSQIALKILGNPSAQGLAEIICAVGLAQNLSALRALASEGIQRGHMSLHQKNKRLAAGQAAQATEGSQPCQRSQ